MHSSMYDPVWEGPGRLFCGTGGVYRGACGIKFGGVVNGLNPNTADPIASLDMRVVKGTEQRLFIISPDV